MSKKSKAAAQAKFEAIRDSKLALLRKLEVECEKVLLQSLAHGEVEVWNFILCNQQSAEYDKVGEVARLECVLCDESKSVQDFFRAHGFSF